MESVEMRGTRVVFPEANRVALEAFELPEDELGDHEVLVRTHCTVISPGTELANLQARLHFDTDVPPAFPMPQVGYANVGTVLVAGSATGVAPGDRVYTMGAHASVVRVDMRDRLCVPVPEGLADEDAAFARFAQVSMTTLVTTRARPGAEVGVVGLGLVGNVAAQVFAASGYRVTGFDLSARRRELAIAAGIDARDGSEVADFGQRMSLVIEATGSARALPGAVAMTKPGGEIVMIGAPWGGAANSVPSSEITRLLFFRFLTLRSGSEWEVPRQPEPLVRGSHQEHAATALGWLANGRLRVQPLITDRIRPEGVAAAYAGLQNAPDAHLGVVIDWS